MPVTINSLSDVSIDGGQSMDLVSHASHARTSDDRSALHLAALAYEARLLRGAAVLEKAEEALLAGDLDTVKQLLQPAVDEAKQTERDRRIAEAAKALAEAQAHYDEVSRAEAAEVEAVRP